MNGKEDLQNDIEVAEEKLEMLYEIFEERELEGLCTESIEDKIIAQKEYLTELFEVLDRVEDMDDYEYTKYEIIEGR